MAISCDRRIRHQFECNHPEKVFEWEATDGCWGQLCKECLTDPKSPFMGSDIKNLKLIGQPEYNKDGGSADSLIHIMTIIKQFKHDSVSAR